MIDNTIVSIYIRSALSCRAKRVSIQLYRASRANMNKVSLWQSSDTACQQPTTKQDKNDSGFSLAELMAVLVIISVLVLRALPKLLPMVTEAKTTEAKFMLKQIHTLEQSYKFEHDRYGNILGERPCGQF